MKNRNEVSSGIREPQILDHKPSVVESRNWDKFGIKSYSCNGPEGRIFSFFETN
jgi:hypothetical protein